MRRFVSLTAVTVLVAMALAATAIVLLSIVTRQEGRFVEELDGAAQQALHAERLRARSEYVSRLVRTYLLSPSRETLEQLQTAGAELRTSLTDTRAAVDPEERWLVRSIEAAIGSAGQLSRELIEARRSGSSLEAISGRLRTEHAPLRLEADRRIGELVEVQGLQFEQLRTQMLEVTQRSFMVFLTTVVILSLLLVGLVLLAIREVRDRQHARDVAEHKSAEVEAILASIPDMVLVTDEQKVVRANEKALELVGPVIGQGLEPFIASIKMEDCDSGAPLPPEEMPLFKTLKTARIHEREMRVRDSSTLSTRYLRVIAAPVRVRDNRLGSVVIATDITRAKVAERDLRISEAMFAGIISIAGEAILSIDESWRITIFNHGAEKMFGYAAHEVIGRSLETLIPERFRKRHRRSIAAFARSSEVTRRIGERLPFFALRRSGEEFPAEAAISKLELDGRRIFAIILRDTSQRRRAEREQRFLAHAGEVLSASLDYEKTLSAVAKLSVTSIADWSLVYLHENGRVWRHDVVQRGKPKSELARRLREFQVDLTRTALVQEVMRERKPLLISQVTREMLTATAASREHFELLEQMSPVSLMAVPMLLRDKLLGALVFLSSDARRRYTDADLKLVTGLSRLAALAVENARLYASSRQAARARDEVLGLVAHDLRSPLNAIRFSAEVLLRSEDVRRDERRKGPLKTIVRQVDGMNRLIQDLLDVARIEAGQLSVSRRPLSPESLVREALEAAVPLALGLELRMDLPPSLPLVLADRDRILQVLSNLIGNAVKFTPESGRVVLGATVEGCLVRFWVQDTGPGISPAARSQLFQRFWQLERHDRRGAGLGLSIAKAIIEAHQGRIGFESEPGKGATFYFTLPRAPERRLDRESSDAPPALH